MLKQAMMHFVKQAESMEHMRNKIKKVDAVAAAKDLDAKELAEPTSQKDKHVEPVAQKSSFGNFTMNKEPV